MNLTVGPLPPAVYWRRRAIVLGVLLLAVILLVSTCSGTGGKASKGTSGTQGTGGGQVPSGQASILAPVIGSDGGNGGDAGGDNATGEPASLDPTLPAAAGAGDQLSPSGPCADGDLSLIAVATPLAKGFYFSMRVRNTSSDACSRDLGGGPQALEVVNAGGTVVWTSDYCMAAGRSPAPDVRTFGPNIETILPARPFYWDGTLGRCNNGSAPGAGPYRLVARLGTKASQPVSLTGK